MKYFFGLVFIVVFNVTASKAQNHLPPAYEIKADTALDLEVPDKNWQILEDPTGKLTIGRVSSPAFDNKFHINNTRTKGYDYHITNYWLRYTFKNTLNHTVKVAIDETVAYAYLYTRKPDSTWQVQTTGSLVPYNQRAGLKRMLYFIVTIPAGQAVTFYEKDIFDFWLNKPTAFIMHIGFADAVIQKRYIDNDKDLTALILNSIAFGILILAALVNLLFYRIVREKMYLFFALFLIGFAGWIFCSSAWEVFKEHLYTFYILDYTCLIGFFFMLMHFIRNYLSTDKHTPKWDKFLIILSGLLVVTWTAFLFLPTTLNYRTYLIISVMSSVVIYSYMPVILVTMFFYLRKNQAAKPGILALLPSMLWLGIGYIYLYVCGFLNREYQVPYTRLYNWMNDWNDVVLLVCMFWLIAVFSWILFKRYQDLQQSLAQSSLEREIERSQLIEKQNEELEKQVEARTTELKHSLENLKITQQQLIQSEKLASLGELTAGIAHEIQNPLNFVNNFAEVSMELVEEMGEGLNNGDKAEALEIANDIKNNLEKIRHHGRRADSIVKGMLQHSRNNNHVKEPTDINKLADEYLRLAYHGLRAKDKSFNADMATHFADDLPLVNIVPQDIGRVLLNLFTNAFYATQQKQKAGAEGYKPMLELSTRLSAGQGSTGVEIMVKDNGTGIPGNIKEKILQPFFTTKPTGEGTGLGLSISYDILVKGHDGKINIDTATNGYTIFTIWLPIGDDK